MKILNDKINLGLAICVGILVYSGFASLTLLSRYEDFSHWVLHTNRVLERIKDIRSMTEEMSSAAKTFVITGNKSTYSSSSRVQEKLKVTVGEVNLLITDNPVQSENVASLMTTLETFFSGLAKMRSSQTLANNDHTQAVLRVLDKMEGLENKLLSERLIASQMQADAARKVMIGRTIFAVSIVGGLTLLLNQQLTHRKTAEESILALNHRLSTQLAELDGVNKELEAFSYSVSHDLRAPLRSIMGFSQMVKEDYSKNLEREGIDYLNRIIGATRRMGELIDSLLKMSRLGRREVVRESLDLVALINTIMNDLRERDVARQLEMTLPARLPIKGDPVLLRVVFENLLGNAWKFTRNRPIAEIEVGQTKTDKGLAFFVKDNGVGFDMQYVGKLFNAFQRLHSQNDFEGIGIGLATVQRIVHRHGGSIWVQSQLNLGTTFYFLI